jgi:hypothetical protein
MELFCCAIVPCLDFSGWRSRMVASILRNLCQVYLDVVTTELKAKISTAIQMVSHPPLFHLLYYAHATHLLDCDLSAGR